MLATLACVLALAACNNGGGVELGVDGDSETKIPSADSCVGDDCGQDNKNVFDGPCKERVAEMPGGVIVDAVGIGGEGTLIVVTSTVDTPPTCQQLYWAMVVFNGKVTPNTTPYQMVLTISDDEGGRRSTPLVVNFDRPGDEAVTNTLKGRRGQHLEACINSVPPKPEQVCTTRVDVP